MSTKRYTTPACMFCHRKSTLHLDPEEAAALRAGVPIQDAAPNRSAPERERIRSGIHPHCWTDAFGPTHEEENPMTDITTRAFRRFVEVFAAEDTAADLASRLSCTEIDALVDLLAAAGAEDAAACWLDHHGPADDPGDEHYLSPDVTPDSR
ncbi:hypothetical protein NY547_13250 [Cnuibacter physcomitrellae]|uniref:hypothetical protein n=1 Tax=Cnuibacter physcomitrellae TaxID=1619308 RepID=UPI002175A1FF|nr:hypothetical protein [Cnuibacter physcomitrellae]MCS5498210.1 hypothetical protein [Cnuibacter physcomitrellae]